MRLSVATHSVKCALGPPLPPDGATVLAAVSGGADSVAMLHILAQSAPERGWRLVAAHVDHGLRESSAADAAFMAELARSLGLECLSRRVTVPIGGGLSPEEAARLARRRALAELAEETGAVTVALAHTADDQAETLLARLFAGSGPTGLAGMRPADGLWWRPLLAARRADLRAFLAGRGLAWREDPTNQDQGPLRNRVRARLLPLAEALVNPRSVEALGRLAALAADEEAAWEAWCAEVFAAHGRVEGDSLLLGEAAFAPLGPAQRRRLVRWLAGRLTGQGQHLLALHTEQALGLMAGEAGRAATLPGGLVAWREEQGFRLGPDAPPPAFRHLLPAPGVLALPHIGKSLLAEMVQGSRGRAARGPVAWLPAASLRWPLEVRPPKEGERFHALGAPGGKKLARWLVDQKIPVWWRARTPVVADAGGIWWVGPRAVAQRAGQAAYEGEFCRLSLVDTPAPHPYTKA